MEDSPITINIEPASSNPNLKVIKIKGSFDAVTSNQVNERVWHVMQKENVNIVLDLSTLDYLSSIGMLCLIKYVAFMTDEKRLMKFVKPPKHIYSTFEAAGIAKKFDMYDSTDAAISSLR
jgi:anti-anti-sigma factor